MNENIDLTKILKDCPKGWKFYSSIYGDIIFDGIGPIQNYPIIFSLSLDNTYHISVTKQGQLYSKYVGECTVFPSKEQRDWSKFTAPWLKEERFPKTWEDFIEIMNLMNLKILFYQLHFLNTLWKLHKFVLLLF